MKTLVCEMCGSRELLKQNGVFVCQNCGVKYSADEAKKMMIEGVVEVSGTVTAKIDLSGIKRIAEEAFDRGDFKLAYEQYCKIAEQDPDDYQSYFKRTIAYIKQPFTIEDYDAISMPYQLLDTYIDQLENDSTLTNDDRVLLIGWAITQIGLEILGFLNLSHEVNLSSKTITEGSHGLHLKIMDYYIPAYDKLINLSLINSEKYNFQDLSDTALILAKDIIARIDDLYIKHKNSITGDTYFLSDFGEQSYKENAMVFIKYAKKIDPSYEPPKRFIPPTPSVPKENSTDGGCYIATCVYGSYDCPEVWTLRRFRDNTLGATWYGRLFIKAYYLISPTLVKWFGKTNWFRKSWKIFLDNMINDLQSKGVESSPYQDKNW